MEAVQGSESWGSEGWCLRDLMALPYYTGRYPHGLHGAVTPTAFRVPRCSGCGRNMETVYKRVIPNLLTCRGICRVVYAERSFWTGKLTTDCGLGS